MFDFLEDLIRHDDKLLMYSTEPQRINRRQGDIGQVMFKVILIGDSAVGKSSLISRYANGIFRETHEPTLGAQFASKVIKMDGNYHVKLQIWDTAGQQTFRSLIRTFFRNSGAVLLFYKINCRKSFNSLNQWLATARQNSSQSAIFVLIGTHLDLEEKREVSILQAEKWMRDNGVSMFFEVSAKNDINISKAFEEVAKQMFLKQLSKRRITQVEEQSKTVEIKPVSQPLKKCC